MLKRNSKKRMTVAKSGWLSGLHPGMALAAKAMVLAFVFFTILNVELANAVYGAAQRWIETTLSWYYVLTICVMLFATLYLVASRHGSVRLGSDDARPEFGTFSWLAMLFSAGLGIGILFFSISEPLFYFDTTGSSGYPNNPHADHAGAVVADERRATHAMRVVYFHWGFHAWAVYVIVGLCLAYFGFRKKLPLTLRSALYPLLGDRIYGPLGHAVDLLAVFGAVFGVATSLGLGAAQIAAGLNELFGLDSGTTTQIIVIAVITGVATLSAVSGVGRGIRVISEWNIYISMVLLGYFLFFGPFEWLMGFFVTTVGEYAWNVVPMGFWTAAAPGNVEWQGTWTVFYWAWWIAWAPFVGMFIARISRGRTIREFTFGVLLVPTVMGIIWICVFGGNALHLELYAEDGVGTAGILEWVRNDMPQQALYATINAVSDIRWLTWTMAALATLLLATWFITSSDSCTLVVATMLSLGNDHPPQRFRLIWGTSEGFVAAMLLLTGGLGALQAATVAAALPVSVVLLAMTFGIIKSLNEDSSAAA